jgi:hypothetical protein
LSPLTLMQAIADEKAAAKADARAATASERETALSSERDKAFEALKQENERLRQALTSVMRQVEAAMPPPHSAAASTGMPPPLHSLITTELAEVLAADPAAAEPEAAQAGVEVAEAAEAAEAAAPVSEAEAAAAAAGFVSIDAQIVQLQEKIRWADEAGDFGECGRLTEKIRALEARQPTLTR